MRNEGLVTFVWLELLSEYCDATLDVSWHNLPIWADIFSTSLKYGTISTLFRINCSTTPIMPHLEVYGFYIWSIKHKKCKRIKGLLTKEDLRYLCAAAMLIHTL